MRAVLNSYMALMSGETYLILDQNKRELGKLNVFDNFVNVKFNNEDEDDPGLDLKEDEIVKWFTTNQYLISKISPRWVEFNPNPVKSAKANDCTIRAYCAAENLEWDEAYDIACKRGKDCAYMPNDKPAVGEILEKEFGYRRHRVEKEDKGMTVEEFAIKFDVGTYLVVVARHLVAVIDGKYYDSWDSGKKKVSCYYSKD